METHFNDMVPDGITKALCTTLIHSLWQGFILALVTGMTIVLTKKSTAAWRYNFMFGYLFLFTAAIAFTFYQELPTIQAAIASPNRLPAFTSSEQPFIVNQQAAEKPAAIISAGIDFFNRHSDTIVLIWFLVICARFVQFAVGLQGIYQLKRTRIIAAGAYWENKITALASELGIKKTVTILQSGLAKVPMVIGHFKPVILIPIGLFTALSTEEVEAVLRHELAHIKRDDYLVNLLQNLMEIIFFFNPAVLWVSAIINTERENCCDDMVIAQASSKVSYIKALVSCEEYSSAAPAHTMGLGGKDGHFLRRVKRMLSNNNQTLNRVEKMVLTMGLIVGILLTTAFSKSNGEHQVLKMKPERGLPSLPPTTATNVDSTNGSDTLKNKAHKIYQNSDLKEGSAIELTNRVNHKKYHLFVFKKGAPYINMPARVTA